MNDKRKGNPSRDAERRQEELDFDQDEGFAEAVHPPAEDMARARRPRPTPGDAAAASGHQAESPAEPFLPAPAPEGAWQGFSGMNDIGATTTMKTVRIRRIAALAAAVALAAALGALAGSLATGGFGAFAAASRADASEAALKLALDKVEKEVAALRATVEARAHDLEQRTTRIAERLDRSQLAQVEPSLKLAKVSEAIERLEKRVAQNQPAAQPAAQSHAQAAGGDVTGAIGEPRAAAAEAKPGIVGGWTLRQARVGVALIEGREGLVEIEPGDILPGAGRVQAIKKQEGRWVVVTTRGLIVER